MDNGDIWIIHGGTRKITVCSSTYYVVNGNFCCRHSKNYIYIKITRKNSNLFYARNWKSQNLCNFPGRNWKVEDLYWKSKNLFVSSSFSNVSLSNYLQLILHPVNVNYSVNQWMTTLFSYTVTINILHNCKINFFFTAVVILLLSKLFLGILTLNFQHKYVWIFRLFMYKNFQYR